MRVPPWRSFRVRMVLLASTLSALVLVGFGYYAIAIVTRVSLDRMDIDLLDAARRHLVAPGGARC